MTAYSIYAVPATERRSRFALDVSPTGIRGLTPGKTIVGVYHHLLADRLAALAPAPPPVVTVTLRKVALDVEGSHVIASAGTIERARTHAPVPADGTTDLKAGELLDDVLLGGDSWRTATEVAVWTAARQVAELERMRGQVLRELNTVVQLVTLARAGVIDVKPWELPL